MFLIEIYAVVMPVFVEGGCLSENDEFTNSIKILGNIAFSSKLIRALHPSECNGHLSIEPCHVYTTDCEPDPSTNIIINF